MRQPSEPSSSEPHTLDDAVQRARAEFLEMPGLRLTPAQAVRLWGVDAALCDEVLAWLVDTHFLVRSGNAFVRAAGGRDHPRIDRSRDQSSVSEDGQSADAWPRALRATRR